jgi:N-dimethylarginine dimethylaminohydrolase
MKPQPQILMCSPDYFGIEYEINPWMNRERQADHAVAEQQWRALYDILHALGANVSLIDPVPGLPDLVFTANAALIYRNRAVLSHFRPAERQAEEPYFRRWLTDRGFQVVDPPNQMHFEGAGDALFCGDTLFAGYRSRSDALGHQQIGALLACRVIPLELVNPFFYHLDTCFCPLADGVAAWYPAAFDDYGRRAVPQLVKHLIEVKEEEAKLFACNAVVVGRTVVTNTGCPHFHDQLAAAGFHAIATPLEEFTKAGGSAKCLTLRIDGEEAARWRTAAAQVMV